MYVLELLLGLNSKKVDATTAFIHAYIPDNEKVYVEIARGFEKFSKNGRKKWLKLKKALYGLRQNPCYFWK